MEVNLSTKGREMLPALFVNLEQERVVVTQDPILSRRFIANIVACRCNFQINRAKKSRYRFREFLLLEKTTFKLEERFQRMICEIYNLSLTKGIITYLYVYQKRSTQWVISLLCSDANYRSLY